MRGIETAFWATLIQDLELKTSASGKPYCNFGCAVVTGKADTGKDVSQYIRVACFGDTASKLESRAAKGDKIYVEGSLTLTQWNDAAGEVKHGVNVAAWKCERVSNIGKSRERKPQGEATGSNGNRREVPASYCARPAGPRPHANAEAFDFDRGDLLPW
jgi:single-stranded DNA-binding protein